MKSPDWPGLSITLRVHEDDLKEYEDDEAEESSSGSVVRYVEAVPGTNFSVELRVKDYFRYKSHDLRVAILMDGVAIRTNIFGPRHRALPIWDSCKGILNRIRGEWQLEKFAFAELQTSDGPAKANLKEKLSNIGEITIELTRVRELGPCAKQDRVHKFESVVSSGVPEKALKGRAISNHVKLSKPERATHGTTSVDVEYPWGEKPFLSFKFKYRSYRDLQVEGIIPRSPSPMPLEERDLATLSREEAQEVIRRQQERIDGLTKVKTEKRERDTVIEDDDDDDDDEVTFTSETRPRKRHRSLQDSGIEIIDLSDD